MLFRRFVGLLEEYPGKSSKTHGLDNQQPRNVVYNTRGGHLTT